MRLGFEPVFRSKEGTNWIGCSISSDCYVVEWKAPHFKQFVVTNCSKERPGSIVNETLKNGILMLKYTSKESDFHADFKYISFIKFSLCHQKLRA